MSTQPQPAPVLAWHREAAKAILSLDPTPRWKRSGRRRLINPAKYPPGWRKVRIGSPEKVGDRYIMFTDPVSSKLSDWSEITDASMCASASSPEFTVIRKIEKKDTNV